MLVRIGDNLLQTDVCDDDMGSFIYFIQCDDQKAIQQYFGSNMSFDCTCNPEDECDPMTDPHYDRMTDPYYITTLDYFVYKIGSKANKPSGLESEEGRVHVCNLLAASEKKARRGTYVCKLCKLCKLYRTAYTMTFMKLCRCRNTFSGVAVTAACERPISATKTTHHTTLATVRSRAKTLYYRSVRPHR